jgi:hypothetical protein
MASKFIGPRRASYAEGLWLASTLSTRLPSRSTNSNSQSSHSIFSPVTGMWPLTAMSKPASVL